MTFRRHPTEHTHTYSLVHSWSDLLSCSLFYLSLCVQATAWAVFVYLFPPPSGSTISPNFYIWKQIWRILSKKMNENLFDATIHIEQHKNVKQQRHQRKRRRKSFLIISLFSHTTLSQNVHTHTVNHIIIVTVSTNRYAHAHTQIYTSFTLSFERHNSTQGKVN